MLGDFVDLRRAWLVYSALYEHSESRVAKLNEMAPVAFGTMQMEMLRSMAVRISSLTDKTKGTLSIVRLARHLPESGRRDAVLAQVQASAVEIAKWRHNIVAHRNIDYILGHGSVQIAKLNAASFEGAISSIGEFLAMAHEDMTGSELAWPQYVSEIDSWLFD